MTPFCVVFISTPKGVPARRISQALLKARCAACVNIVPGIVSLYWWKGKMEKAEEALLVVKTRKSLLKKLIRLVKSIHPYSTPEIIALPIVSGFSPYLKWIKRETRRIK